MSHPDLNVPINGSLLLPQVVEIAAMSCLPSPVHSGVAPEPSASDMQDSPVSVTVPQLFFHLAAGQLQGLQF